MTDQEFREKAREQYARDGEIEIDDGAEVSRENDIERAGGAYVGAWVWVAIEEEENA